MGRIGTYLAVVPIVDMARRPEHAGRYGRGGFFIAAPQQERIRPAAHLLRVLYEEPDGMFFRTGNEKAKTVEQTARADPLRL